MSGVPESQVESAALKVDRHREGFPMRKAAWRVARRSASTGSRTIGAPFVKATRLTNDHGDVLADESARSTAVEPIRVHDQSHQKQHVLGPERLRPGWLTDGPQPRLHEGSHVRQGLRARMRGGP